MEVMLTFLLWLQLLRMGTYVYGQSDFSVLERKPNSTLFSLFRNRRSLLPTPHASCRTVEEWNPLYSAVDIFGNQVEILQKFTQDSAMVEQHFYERYCDSGLELVDETDFGKVRRNHQAPDGHQCRGIDESKFHGYCVTRHTYTYAKVVTSTGVVGWTRIRVRGGCECALFEKRYSREDVLKYLKAG